MADTTPTSANPVLTLAIESSNPSSGGTPGVALGLTAPGVCELLGDEPLGGGERHDDLLMPAVARLMDRLGRSPMQLGLVAVSVGPGGYTGLRIATAAANLISLATGARVAGVPSAWVVAHRLRTGGPALVCLACKGETAWVTGFDATGAPTDGGRLLTADGLRLEPGTTLVGDRYVPEPFRAAASDAGCPIAESVFDASSCLALAWSVESHEAGGVSPLYGREAEAVTRWRELHG